MTMQLMIAYVQHEARHRASDLEHYRPPVDSLFHDRHSRTLIALQPEGPTVKIKGKNID